MKAIESRKGKDLLTNVRKAPKMTMLEKAKATSLRKKKYQHFTKEELEVALAWARNEITLRQVAYGAFPSNDPDYSYTRSYLWLAMRLREIILRAGL